VEFRTASEFVDQARLHRKGVDLEADYATEMVRRYMVAEYKDAAYQRGYRVTTTSTPGCSVPPRMRSHGPADLWSASRLSRRQGQVRGRGRR